jgi:enoyl-CoA hydratase
VRELSDVFLGLQITAEGEEPTRCAGTHPHRRGKAFVAGADISEMKEPPRGSEEASRRAGHQLGVILEVAPFPVIAAVNGFALGGGCELALSLRLHLRCRPRQVRPAEVNLGVIPGFGGTQRLARRVGIAKARELIYTGRHDHGAEAASLGLVNAVFPAADLLAKAEETAAKIATKGPLAVAAAKRTILLGTEVALPAANQLEAEAFGVLFGSEDQKAGMKAFLEKAKATFTGK